MENKYRLAEMIQARINTREASTLTIAAVAASASLVLLALAASPESSYAHTHHAWLRFAGFLFALLGILYRETTILTVDAADHARLNEILPNLRADPRGSCLRGFMLHALLLSSLAAWVNLLFNSLGEIGVLLDSRLDIMNRLWVILPFFFWLVFLPALVYGKRKQRVVALLMVLGAALIAYWLASFPHEWITNQRLCNSRRIVRGFGFGCPYVDRGGFDTA